MKLIDQTHKIGWIGTGIMGRSMAGHLLKSDFKVMVYNRTKEKALPLLELGAELAESPYLLAEKVDVVCTMVSFPKDVETVILGEEGVLKNLAAGKLIIDFTTSRPSLAKTIYEQAKAKGVYSLDAPVSGGDVGARNATLSIMVGGDEPVYESAMPIFKVLGKTIIYQGAAGAGQHTKMVNQILIAGTMMGLAEALVYAKKSGLNATKVLESVKQGAAASWSLSNLVPRVLHGNFEPGFMVEHFVKDLEIALSEADAMGLKMPALALAKELYLELKEQGSGKLGTQALCLMLAKMNGMTF